MLAVGTGIGSASIECQNKTGHGDAPLPHEVWPKQTVGASVHTSHGTDGPWTAAQDGIHGCNNPAPARHPNGTIFVVCHNKPELILHSAPSVHGPWTTIGNIMDAGNTPVVAGTPHEWTNRTVWEDPHLWIDPETGAFHIICHAYPPCDNSAPYHYGDVVAGHGFSQAGEEWKWSATPPYTRYVQSGGKTLKYGTRERPFLLMEGGAPTVSPRARHHPPAAPG